MTQQQLAAVKRRVKELQKKMGGIGVRPTDEFDSLDMHLLPLAERLAYSARL
jgi:hypothetical protein